MAPAPTPDEKALISQAEVLTAILIPKLTCIQAFIWKRSGTEGE